MQENGCGTHKVSLEMLLGKDQHSSGGIWLLQLVIDGDKGLQGLGRGATVEFLLLVVEGFGVGPAVHGTLA